MMTRTMGMYKKEKIKVVAMHSKQISEVNSSKNMNIAKINLEL